MTSSSPAVTVNGPASSLAVVDPAAGATASSPQPIAEVERRRPRRAQAWRGSVMARHYGAPAAEVQERPASRRATAAPPDTRGRLGDGVPPAAGALAPSLLPWPHDPGAVDP